MTLSKHPTVVHVFTLLVLSNLLKGDCNSEFHVFCIRQAIEESRLDRIMINSDQYDVF